MTSPAQRQQELHVGLRHFHRSFRLGNHTINVVNGSQLHGSIVTGGSAATVSVEDSTIDTGGIYLAGIGTNTISVTNSTVDATNSQVAANLVALFPNQDLSAIDNLAIGRWGACRATR